MGRILMMAGTAVIALVSFGYWYAIDGSTPRNTSYDFQLEGLRAAAAAPASERPVSIGMIEVGRGPAPGFAMGNGIDFSEVMISYPAYQIAFTDGTTVLFNTVAGRDVIEEGLGATFDQAAYDEVLEAMETADVIMVSHEHWDHIATTSQHPNLESFADALLLSQPQMKALPRFSADGQMPEAFADLTPASFDQPTRIAPGIAALATPGHTDGHVTLYVQTAEDQELLMIGDITWVHENVVNATTRPRLVPLILHELKEDRGIVQSQVRALHNLFKTEPDLIILPEHDAAMHDALVEKGVLSVAG